MKKKMNLTFMSRLFQYTTKLNFAENNNMRESLRQYMPHCFDVGGYMREKEKKRKEGKLKFLMIIFYIYSAFALYL